MKHNTQAFSLVMAMGLVILISLLAFVILEYIIPFGKNVKGIENASRAYYQAQSGIEKSLLFLATGSSVGSSNQIVNTDPIGSSYQVIGSGTLLPPVGEGQSEYDSDWNIIRVGQPIQLDIGGHSINWATTDIEFRVPRLASGEPVLSGSTLPIVNWQLASENDLLSADGSWITADIINDFYSPSYVAHSLDGSSGELLENGSQDFEDFYTNECQNSGDTCILKFSIINPLELENAGGYSAGTPVPYLEWRFQFSTNVALRYANIFSQGDSYGYQKRLEVKVPQQTLIEAFDFTVFQ